MFRASCLPVKTSSAGARPNHRQTVNHLQVSIDATRSPLLKCRFRGLKRVEPAQNLPVAGGLMRSLGDHFWFLNCRNHNCNL